MRQLAMLIGEQTLTKKAAMVKLEVMVTSALNGARLDKAIVALVEGASRARVKRGRRCTGCRPRAATVM